MRLPIFLDHHSTTPMDPEVFEAMKPYFMEHFGNPSSRNHEYGWVAESAVEKACTTIAQAIGANPKEILFTSGGTESNNLALFGIARSHALRGKHLITSEIEHKSVLEPIAQLEKEGFSVTRLKPDRYGQIDPHDLAFAIRPDTALVSIMFVNNEIGTVNRIAEIGKICKAKGVLFHTDAVQALGRFPIHVQEMGIDLMTLTAHKNYGPKGVGALYCRRRDPRVRLQPQILGGGHERGLRSGTLNVPGIVGFGKSVEISQRNFANENLRLARLRDQIWNRVRTEVPQVKLNGHPVERHPGNLNLSFEGVEGEVLMLGMRDAAISTGSACASESLEPSYVLKAIGCTDDEIHAGIRIGLGRFTTEVEISHFTDKLIETVNQLREISPVYRVVSSAAPLNANRER